MISSRLLTLASLAPAVCFTSALLRADAMNYFNVTEVSSTKAEVCFTLLGQTIFNNMAIGPAQNGEFIQEAPPPAIFCNDFNSSCSTAGVGPSFSYSSGAGHEAWAIAFSSWDFQAGTLSGPNGFAINPVIGEVHWSEPGNSSLYNDLFIYLSQGSSAINFLFASDQTSSDIGTGPIGC